MLNGKPEIDKGLLSLTWISVWILNFLDMKTYANKELCRMQHILTWKP
jgi:hypothetical protein